MSNISPLSQVVIQLKMFNELQAARTVLAAFFKQARTLEQLDEVAYLQNEVKDYKGSVATLKRCLSVSADTNQMYAVRANMAKMLNHINNPAESIIYSNINMAMNKSYDSLLEIAFSKYLLGDYAASEEIIRGIVAESNVPEDVLNRCLYNLGSYDLELGKFKEGLHGFIDTGHKIGIWKNPELTNQTKWDGSEIEGATVYCVGEGGIGDEIIGVRFMQNIKKLGINPVWVTERSELNTVFTRNGIACCSAKDMVANSLYCYAMYLPILLDIDKDTAWAGPYLQPDPVYVTKWKSKITPDTIAIKWAGNPDYEQDLHRSIGIETANKIVKDYAGPIVGLQIDHDGTDTGKIVNLGSDITSIEDTLAIISLCKTTITSCTSVAHMIGAMGAPGIVCPPIASYYVWLGMDGNKSHWYNDKLKVFRQTQHKNWDSVAARIAL
jgi:tetratricopeptide (TPR) repeat protein